MKTLIAAIICCCCCLGAQAEVPLDITYRFPVVAKVLGQAGTDWRTEVCVTNLADDPIEIRVVIHGSPAHMFVKIVELNGHMTACSEDVVAELFQLTDYTGWMYVRIEWRDHAGKALPAITAGVKIYNAASQGTYGQEIQPIHFCGGVDELDAYFGIVSGVQHWGVPGESGFRTNIGATSLELFSNEVVTVEVRGPSGASRWREQFELGNYRSHQFSLPPSVRVHNGFLTIRSEQKMAAWVSIVDNLTGDGVFRVPIQVETSDLNEFGEVSKDVLTDLAAHLRNRPTLREGDLSPP